MIPFSPPRIDQKIIDEVIDTLKSGWITTGPKTKLFDCLNKELSPDELGFKRTTTGHPILNKAEVWTDSECLLVEYRYYYRNLIKILDEI